MKTTSQKLKFIAFIVACCTCVFLLPAIISLAWMIPMTLKIFFSARDNKRITPAFIILATIFMINPAITVLLLYSENIYTRRKWIYYAALIETIVFGILLFPLAWMIPMTIRYYKFSNAEMEPSLAYKICTIIFFGPLPLTLGYLKGILFLTEREKDKIDYLTIEEKAS